MKLEGGRLRVRTRLGEFRCPLPANGLGAREGYPEHGESFFFPSEAAQVLGSAGAPGEANIFPALVASSTFAGRFRRIVFECEPINRRDGALRLELEFPPDMRLKIGERLFLQVPEERCALLPEEPSGTDEDGGEEENHA
jgi:hypothetical protein